uniref:Cyclin n=1 Tax=Rhodosorus marinus TaxID=101924 RepID=A0A7S2ZEU9_9RHOD|mmetsp:Transcript_16992/g.69224  ORF Transcript_16992/g.69224 Transcript_16992/m.69224 type:complete len:191 (+) Transcript_16992:196-768(+)
MDNLERYDSPAGSFDSDFDTDDGANSLTGYTLKKAISREMETFCCMNDDLESGYHCQGDFEVFSTGKTSTLPLKRFVERMMKYLSCSNSAYVVAFCYIHRIMEHQKDLRICTQNSENLLFAATVTAVKYLEDRVHTNAFYAKVGGLSGYMEMNRLEAQFLKLMNFDLAVSSEEYRTMESYLSGVGAKELK